jgi:hypothetical protein
MRKDIRKPQGLPGVFYLECPEIIMRI